MRVTYETQVIGEGSHASILIPQWVLDELKTNKRAPVKVTINGHTYRSTAVGVAGECRVVFPAADREAANAKAGDDIRVTLELDAGYREVDVPSELAIELDTQGLVEAFSGLSYSKRKEFARQVSDAKTAETKERRVLKVIEAIRNL